ncbi:prolyl oligopeptidase family serine peptidase [bacterium]|nr:prolyl oligopeptidase family serine peptidase [bacterium]
MSKPLSKQAPYGSWPSPISAQILVSGAVGISELVPDGPAIWWAESRPEEGGRVAIMHHEAGNSIEVTPADANVRTLMHEYGGGAWWAADSVLWYVDYNDQRLREMVVGTHASGPVLLSEAPATSRARRFADIRPTLCGHWLICVCERHSADREEPENLICAVARDGSFKQLDIATGADFYGSVCLSPDGKQLAWVQWDHPNMPWDTTTLVQAAFASDAQGIRLDNICTVAGGHEEAVVQPLFSPDNQLHYLSDRNDCWHLFKQGQDKPVLEVDGEIGYPPWVHGMARYGFADDGQIVVAYYKDGIDHLAQDASGTAFGSIRLSGSRLAYTCASWTRETSVHYDGKLIRAARELPLSDDYLPAPEVLSFPTGTDAAPDTAHALFYAPANPEFTAPDGEKPPLIVLAHGGPTSAARSQLSLAQRFWTSRGFAVVDVNYRGSSGYGRAYRKKLDLRWGIADVEDCVAVAQYLAKRGDVDSQRLIIRGGSAGGFTVLSALAMHDTFTAGASLYGVADLEALAKDTHKFESRYLDSLIGRWPEDAEVYKERSPINHLDGFDAPMIVLQGAQDAIVPPNQSRMIVDALDKRGLPVAYLEFPGEQHGFRQAKTIITATLSELAFYGQVFKFTPAGETIPLKILNL